GLLGYGSLSLDSDRYVASVNDFARAKRSGSQVFGSVSSGYEYRDKNSLLSPYARYDFAIDRLDAVTETGAGLSALHYAAQSGKTQQISLGLRAETQRKMRFGSMLPRVRIEYQRHIEGNSQALVSYADMLDSTYTLATTTSNTNALLLGVGSGFMLHGGVSIDFSYQRQHAAGSETSDALFFRLTKTLGGK
ncbi:MAG TPA: autotransporter outer membrane beta-barrel domain-containing protein, partial [Gallionella sp.]|nr:autotransporter outer membrane beta-barrel domain-containing protein [Gallionella sp.]